MNPRTTLADPEAPVTEKTEVESPRNDLDAPQDAVTPPPGALPDQLQTTILPANHTNQNTPPVAEESVVPNPPSTPDGTLTPSSQLDDTPLNKDDREVAQWESRYVPKAIAQIRIDAIFVGIVFITTLVLLILTWRGTLFNLGAYGCGDCDRAIFDKYLYFFLGGLLGGTLFGIKFLYKVVARGYWNMDRRLWRIFSPFISGGLALAVGTLIDSGVLGLTTKSAAPSTFFSIGFITGYFADSALAKMQEIAETVFGATARSGVANERRPK